jgi:hypothetical protein
MGKSISGCGLVRDHPPGLASELLRLQSKFLS